MNALPSSEQLASMVSNVTKTLFGMSFSMAASDRVTSPWHDAPPWRMAQLPIHGARPLIIAIAADHAGGATLGSAMFSCPLAKVDTQMIEDSLSELVNIVAGQIKGAMGLDQALGLPSVLAAGDAPAVPWHSATVRANGAEATVWVAIRESNS